MTKIFTIDFVQKMFPYTNRGNIEKYLPSILGAFEKYQIANLYIILVGLATIRAETEAFLPISEGESKYNTDKDPFDLYDYRRDLGNNAKGEGREFCGRGFIQLTGKYNYRTYGIKTGYPNLLEDPELANNPIIASELLVVFIKDKEDAILKAISIDDTETMRRLVNGGSHGLTRFAEAYMTGKKLLEKGSLQ